MPGQVLESGQVKNTATPLSVYIHIHRVTKNFRQRLIGATVGVYLMDIDNFKNHSVVGIEKNSSSVEFNCSIAFALLFPKV